MKNFNNIEPYKDMFNIYNLITKIDKNYKLYFDKKEKCFLIINTDNFNEICLKFNDFSFNVLKNLQETRIENYQKIIKDIDFQNERLVKSFNRQNKNILYSKIEDLVKFSSRTNKILQSDIDKIIEVKNA